MPIYRLLCASILAWAAAWVLGRPEGATLLDEVPEMAVLGPLAAAYVGGFSLSVRQGWGMIVALANGVWAGLLAIAASGILFVALELARAASVGAAAGLRGLVAVYGDTVDVLLAQLGDLPLLALSLAASACAGVLTEAIHWLLVRVRAHQQRSN